MVRIEFNEVSVGNVNSANEPALKVKNKTGVGLWGESTTDGRASGVVGVSKNHNGVSGESTKGIGVNGASLDGGVGVVGTSEKGNGMFGLSTESTGVAGKSTNGTGVHGASTNEYGVKASGGKAAGRFEGDVEVTGDIRMVNADCAEDFDVSDAETKENVEAGTVMVLTENGSLQQSYQEYDKKVAGIVSGASGYKPAIVLDRQEVQQYDQNSSNTKNNKRLPIALMGKVYCKVDATDSAIEIGDLLTTSSTKGYAMKAQDPMKAFGAVIGKALGSIKEGTMGMIPVLVALQ